MTIHKPYPVSGDIQKKIRKSNNHNICEVQKSTKVINVQYNQFNSTCEALKQIHKLDKSCIIEKLPSLSLVVKFIWEFIDSKFINQWSTVVPCCSGYHYCKTQVMCRFKSCSQDLSIISAGNKVKHLSSVNHTTKRIHHHHVISHLH